MVDTAKRILVGAATLLAMAAGASAQAVDSPCDPAAKEAVSRANDLFRWTWVTTLGRAWRLKLPESAVAAFEAAAEDIRSSDPAVRIPRGVAALDKLSEEYGKLEVEGEGVSAYRKRVRSWFGVWNGEARLMQLEGWYLGEETVQETQIALPVGAKLFPDPRDVRMEGRFRSGEGEPVTYTGTLDQWLMANVPDGCAEAALARFNR
jgi:hypothetical protein